MGFLSGGLGGLLDVATTAFTARKSKEAAQDQMAFQSAHSATSFQRQMADMKKAGLNPILASKFTGASTPPGAMAQVPQFSNPISTGLQQKKTATETEAIEKSKLLTEAKTLQQKIDNTLKGDLLPGSETTRKLQQQVLEALDFTISAAEKATERESTLVFKKMKTTVANAIRKASKSNPQFSQKIMNILKDDQQKELFKIYSTPERK